MFKITIETESAAFRPYQELETARILREIAENIEGGANAGKCIDGNGNTVGDYVMEDLPR